MTAESRTFITLLEGSLRACVDLVPLGGNAWQLSLALDYDGDAAGSLSFTLSDFTQEEALELARNAGKSQFIMQAVDEHLWGEMD